MKNINIDKRKTDQGSVRLKLRLNGNNPASYYLEIYDKTTKKQSLQFLNLYITGNEIEDGKTELQAKQRLLDFEGIAKNKAGNFTTYYLNEVEQIEKVQSRDMYYHALKKLQKFAGAENITFKRIDERFLKQFRVWIQSKATHNQTGALIKRKTQSNYFNLISDLAKRARNEGYINQSAFNPDKIEYIQAEVHNEIITFTFEEILKLQATPYPKKPMLPKAFILQFATLQRWSDIRNMTWETLNTNGIFKQISQQKTGKEVPTILNEKLLSWIAGKNIKAGYIFQSQLPTTDEMIRRHLRKWVAMAGIKKDKAIGTHIFRRTGATLLHEIGLDIYIISKLLGHSTIEQTKVYIGLKLEDYKKGFEAMNTAIIEKMDFSKAS